METSRSTQVETIPWSACLIGRLSFNNDGREISRFRTRMTAALIAYLAYYKDRPHPREVLIDLFWPDVSVAAGRNRLSTALSSLRSQFAIADCVGDGLFITDHFSVRINPKFIRTDVAIFEASIAQARRATSEQERYDKLSHAINLYNGELLPGLYDSWIMPEQERLKTVFLDAAHTLVHLCVLMGHHTHGLDVAHQAIAVDPSREEAHADLVTIYVAAGKQGDARRYYEAASNLLKRSASSSLTVLNEAAKLIENQETNGVSSGYVELATVSTSSTQISAPRSLLPRSLTRFFGRKDQIQQLLAKINNDAERLVTVLGSSGMGKTRVALEVAHASFELYQGRVWVVWLADIQGTDQLLASILNSIVTALPKTSEKPVEQIIEVLQEAPSLLILDNFEHLGEAEALVVSDLLKQVPHLTCLVTSRRMLNLTGENVFLLAPLPVPTEPASLETLAKFASVALFVDRGRAIHPNFALTSKNAVAIMRLCQCLEGIPLALELAAARVSMFTPAQILAQVEKRFLFLYDHKIDTPERHRSLRAAVDWSYDLLPATAQDLLAHLAVFRGGWTLSAAKSVARPHTKAIDDLQALLESSFVTSLEECGDMRFRMLETFREYAGDRFRLLEDAEQQFTYHRHRTFFLSVAEEAATHLQSAEQQEWLNRLEVESDNMRIALDSCSDQHLPQDKQAQQIELRLASALHRFWLMRGHLTEGRQRLGKALNICTDAPDDIRGKAVNGAGILALSAGDYEEATYLFGESLILLSNIGDMDGVARALNNLGLLSHQSGDLVGARDYFQASLVQYRALQDEARISVTLSNLATIMIFMDQLEEADKILRENLDIQRRNGDLSSAASTISNLGHIELQQNNFLGSTKYFTEGLQIRRDLNDENSTAPLLLAIVEVAYKFGFNKQSTRLLGAVKAILARGKTALSPADCTEYDNDVHLLKEQVGEADYEHLWHEGFTLGFVEAIDYALEVLADISSRSEVVSAK